MIETLENESDIDWLVPQLKKRIEKGQKLYVIWGNKIDELFDIRFKVVENIETIEHTGFVDDFEYIEVNPTFNYTNILLENNCSEYLREIDIRLTNPRTGKIDIIKHSDVIPFNDEIKLLNAAYYEDGLYYLGLNFIHSKTLYFTVLTIRYKSFETNGSNDNIWIIDKIQYFAEENNKWVEIKLKARKLRKLKSKSLVEKIW